MSAKWVRSKQWERQHLTGALTPVRWVLHAFSTIIMSVTLLVLLSLYGVLASIPIGMLALIPTWLVYALTLVLTVGLLTVLPLWLLWTQLRSRDVSFALRFAVTVLGVILLLGASSALWYQFVWPRVYYDPLTGEGLRFFSSFAERYRAETVRRLPGMEMSELEFYAWWPLNLLLYLFMTNMVVTTVRRIEFTFVNIGVLTVHTGIITLALGSAYYALLKQEGDTLLTAGPIDTATGDTAPGPPEPGFFDNTRTVLRVRQIRSTADKVRLQIPPGLEWEQRPLTGVPRYNEYGLGVISSSLSPAGVDLGDKGRSLDEPVAATPPPESHGPLVDLDIQFRLVGYAPYAELTESWQHASAPEVGTSGGRSGDMSAAINNPVRFVTLLSSVMSPGASPPPSSTQTGGEPTGVAPSGDSPTGGATLRPVQTFGLAPRIPAERLGLIGEAIAIESFANLPDERFDELKAPLPEGARHGLIVEVPASELGPAAARVYAMAVGKTIELNGYRISVKQLSAEPTLPILTPGYRGATSSVAIVKVEAPAAGGKPAETFDRYVYSRLPELNQDLVEGEGADPSTGQPKRRGADARLRLTYIDATQVQVYLDERSVPAIDRPADLAGAATATVRAILRVPGRDPVVREGLRAGDRLEIGPMAVVEVGPLLASARRVGVPRVVPTAERDRDNTGNHRRAVLAVELIVTPKQAIKTNEPGAAAKSAASTSAALPWRQTVWLPFRQYYGLEPQEGATVRLPDGRQIELVFGRLWRELPGMTLQLAAFEMFPYPHSSQPRDFRSELIVRRTDARTGAISEQRASTSLNEPLLASAFEWREERNVIANSALWVAANLGPAQYKLSQSGWDPTGWNETKARVEAGELKRPSARFTILGVGNNPGISIIALGGILMGAGIPWAFYIKPWIVRRKRDKIIEELRAAGKLPAGKLPAGGGQSAQVAVQIETHIDHTSHAGPKGRAVKERRP